MMFLKLKSWQLFILMLTPLILSTIDKVYWVTVTIDIIGYILIFGWFLSVGVNLNESTIDDEKSSDAFFIINCIYLIIITSLSSIFSTKQGGDLEMPSYLLFFSTYTVIAYFHVVYFFSKAFIAAQDVLPLKDRLNWKTVFLLSFIFLVGVWIIQPRINKIIRVQ